MNAEVVVVGGGPAGAATAAWLASEGRDVLLLEKAITPREKSCAEYFSPGVVDELERLGVLEDVRKAGAAWPLGIRIVTRRQNFLVSYPTAGGPPRTALGMKRSDLDAILLMRAKSSGARVQNGTLATGVTTADGRVTGMTLRTSAGAAALSSRWVVGADGLHSVVAASLGLHRRPWWPRRLGLVARFEGAPERLQHVAEMHVGQGLYCGIAPVGDGVVNAGLVAPMRRRGPREPAEHFYERCLSELPGAERALRGAKRVTPVRGTGPLARRAKAVAGPGFLLVGDAAGFFDPFTGEGVYRALRGARLAAGAIGRAQEAGSSRPLGYEQQYHKTFDEKGRFCLLIQLMLGAGWPMDYALARLGRRAEVAEWVLGVLGDYGEARLVTRPSFLWKALAP